ncbi:uncharacterized protein LOC111285155 [Durio zibethinus]|uniref:Uncharacterized protein LOC111285155 n=1 Tax=Durio zibethinus TaxID=66656 RepID=A0A6P5XQK3_DURZI|nr:uncharacterized protein LOC111285155 [Durio zibethinus]
MKRLRLCHFNFQSQTKKRILSAFFKKKMRNRISSSSSFQDICFFFWLGLAAFEVEHSSTINDDADKIRSQFLHLLRTRRSPRVPLTVEPAKPVLHPFFQEVPIPTFSEAMESCPKAPIKNLKERLQGENLYLHTEAGEQGQLPVLILSLKDSSQKRRPAVVFLHSTNKNKEWLRSLLEAYASREYIAIAIDSRYHGERAHNLTTYRDALVSSWKKGDTMPFLFDTGFQWAIDHDKWQARVDSIRAVFEEARIDLGKSAIDKEVVKKVWDRIAPGLASRFDSPYSIPAIAPRPLLILNGADDPRCPIDGIKNPTKRARKAYGKAHSSNNFKVMDGLVGDNYSESTYFSSCNGSLAHRTTWNRPPNDTVNGERSK